MPRIGIVGNAQGIRFRKTPACARKGIAFAVRDFRVGDGIAQGPRRVKQKDVSAFLRQFKIHMGIISLISNKEGIEFELDGSFIAVYRRKTDAVDICQIRKTGSRRQGNGIRRQGISRSRNPRGPSFPVFHVGLNQPNFQNFVFGHKARQQQLIRRSQILRGIFGSSIDSHKNAGAAPAEFLVLSQLHLPRNDARTVFLRQKFTVKPRFCDARPRNRGIVGIRPAPDIFAHHVQRIRRCFQIRPILFRKENKNKALRRNDDISKMPLERLCRVIRQKIVRKIYRRVRRIEEFDPIGFVAIFVFKRDIFRIDFSKNDGSRTNKYFRNRRRIVIGKCRFRIRAARNRKKNKKEDTKSKPSHTMKIVLV